MNLHQIYHRITAAPFIHNMHYLEVAPCQELLPYIKCFWGSKKPYYQNQSTKYLPPPELVIPDTCMDIIFNVDYTNNKIHDTFCGIDKKSHTLNNLKDERLLSTFAIRFYPWSAFLFSEDSLNNAKNTSLNWTWFGNIVFLRNFHMI